MSVLNRVPMNLRKSKDFNETTLGYTKEQAISEAIRCINCKTKPCVKHCPASVPIPEFIECIIAEDFLKAYEIIRRESVLSDICGRVCPQEKQCEGNCVRAIKGDAIAIGHLETFVADMFRDYTPKIATKNNIDIAVVGSGPASISLSETLAILGYNVTIFEKKSYLGGVLSDGIPSFRLPNNIIASHIKRLEKLGVKFKLNTEITDISTLKDFKAIFLGIGCANSYSLGIENEEFTIKATDFLEQININNLHLNENSDIKNAKKAIIIGGGNVAIDCARCARRMGIEQVQIIYRREKEQMPARIVEINHAIEDGVEFNFLTNPVKFKDENTLICSKMTLGEKDESGRAMATEIKGSDFEINADIFIIAIGSTPKIIPGINFKKYIIVDENFKTNIDNVFSGGDTVTGPETVVLAMQTGITCAYNIDKYIKKLN